MRSFQDTFETRKQKFISVLSVCMTVPLISVLGYFPLKNIFNKYTSQRRSVQRRNAKKFGEASTSVVRDMILGKKVSINRFCFDAQNFHIY